MTVATLLCAALAACSAVWLAGFSAASANGEAEGTPSFDREGVRGPEGRWRTTNEWRQHQGMAEDQRKEIERLRSLGYMSGVNPPSAESGVTVHDPERAWSGLNFYTSGDFPGAVLMDMDGEVLHTWSYEYEAAWPDLPLPSPRYSAEHWRNAYLYENGDVLAIFEGAGILKVDRDSRLIWARANGSHHDLEIQDDGRIFVLTRTPHIVPSINEVKPVLEDFVTVLDSEGEELRRISVIDAYHGSAFMREKWTLGMRFGGDITHTNTIEVLRDGQFRPLPAFRAGNVLVSFRMLDAIAVIDLDAEEIVWLAAGGWRRQHGSTMLENGNILLFDNGTPERGSSVVEFSPATGDTVWSYAADAPGGFFSSACGSNARLPNGNTLITESDNGRAIEVTPAGEIVWEYRNPARAGTREELVATIFDMVRLEADFPLDWLEDR